MQHEQFSNPSGDEGKRTLEHMNEHHRGLAEWALSVLPDIQAKRILDVGCGGGMLISLLSELFPDSRIVGIDISEDAVGFTKEMNHRLMKEGRLDVVLGSVSELPFKDSDFDLVTAFETYFFWPDLCNDIKELYRVMKDNGTVLIVSETYPHPKFNDRNVQLIKDYGMNILGNNELAELMEDAGFTVEIIEIEDNNWIAFLGTK
jgi:Methylase involved in ubiquinone/menaquinone biosynthesis